MEYKEIIILDDYINIKDSHIGDDGSIYLYEESIRCSQNVKLAIYSNEQGSHKLPRVHAFYNEKEYVITIDDNFTLLHSSEENKFYKFIAKSYLCGRYLQEARRIWNSTNAQYKFDFANGQYICKNTIPQIAFKTDFNSTVRTRNRNAWGKVFEINH